MFQAHSKSPLVGRVGGQGGQGRLSTEAGGRGALGEEERMEGGEDDLSLYILILTVHL